MSVTRTTKRFRETFMGVHLSWKVNVNKLHKKQLFACVVISEIHESHFVKISESQSLLPPVHEHRTSGIGTTDIILQPVQKLWGYLKCFLSFPDVKNILVRYVREKAARKHVHGQMVKIFEVVVNMFFGALYTALFETYSRRIAKKLAD